MALQTDGARWLAIAFIALVAALPIVASAAERWDGWAAEGDSAVIALRARDVARGRLPLVGMPTTLTERADSTVHHPGPLLFVLLAPLERLWNDHHAPLVSVAVLNASLVGVGVVASSRGRVGRAAIAGSAAIAVVWPLRGDFLVEAFNPYPAALAVGATLAAAAAALSGRWRWLPVAAGTGSLAVQSHLSTVGVVGAVACAVVVGALRSRGAEESMRPLLLAAVVGGVLWLLPAVDALMGTNNLLRVVAIGAGRDGDSLGVTGALRVSANALGALPLGFRGQHPDALALLRPPGVVGIVGAAGVAVGTVLVLTLGSREARAWAGVGSLAIVGGTLTSTRIPNEFFNAFAAHNYLWLWPCTAALGISIAVAIAPHRSRRWFAPLVVAAALFVVAVTVRSTPAPPTGGMRSALPPLTRAVDRELPPDEVFAVAMPEPLRGYSMAAGLVLGLERSGRHIVVPVRNVPAFGAHREETRVRGRLVVAFAGEPVAQGVEIASIPADPAALQRLVSVRRRIVGRIVASRGVELRDGQRFSVEEAKEMLLAGSLSGQARFGAVRSPRLQPGEVDELRRAESGRIVDVRVLLLPPDVR